MITKKVFDVAVRETIALLDGRVYDALYHGSDFDGVEYVDVDAIFENVYEDLTDEDMEIIDAHEASVWCAIARRVSALSDWTAGSQYYTFENEDAYEEVRRSWEEAERDLYELTKEYYSMCY